VTGREEIGRRMRDHYQKVWEAGDAWQFEQSEYERKRYDHLAGLLADRRYGRALEIGCGSGGLTRRLAPLADRLVALDIAEAAVDRARSATAGLANVEVRAANAMEFDLAAEGPWDLVVLTETVYSLGWLYPLFDLAYFAHRLFEATAPGGRLLLANTYGPGEGDWLLRPWLIDTYRDLFRNVGFRVGREGRFHGVKDGVALEVLTTLFARGGGDPCES
jgi:SAM-dependent methyltransferase